MIDLALHGEGGPVSAKEISDREGIPPRYLEQVLNRLKKGHLIHGQRGPGGGYLLSRSPDKISARDVLAVVEDSSDERPIRGFLVGIECGAARQGDRCGDGCLTKRVWITLALKVDEVLSQFSLADLIADAKSTEDQDHETRLP